ncbi:MAG: hypothetical protein HON90_15495 [Halobacteriovoraceae bacterium]|jgi:flagellar biosynthesis/type III secretory pathway chaperone|nr:hypothetical protein [Halobacteriovoraceae bacterium]
METNLELSLKANEFRKLWHLFCERHTDLYETTCDEYMHLLASDIDLLEQTIDEKSKILIVISTLEQQRNEATNDIAKLLEVKKPEKLTEVIELLKANNFEQIAMEVEKLNLVLLDIIDKIQTQNKKNQFFLNKAIHSLRELKESFSGKTNFNTYSSSGMTKSNNTY